MAGSETAAAGTVLQVPNANCSALVHRHNHIKQGVEQYRNKLCPVPSAILSHSLMWSGEVSGSSEAAGVGNTQHACVCVCMCVCVCVCVVGGQAGLQQHSPLRL